MGTNLELYWDTTDPSDAGWAYRYGGDESGAVNDLDDLINVIILARHSGHLGDDLGRLVTGESEQYPLCWGVGDDDEPTEITDGYAVVAWDASRVLLADLTVQDRASAPAYTARFEDENGETEIAGDNLEDMAKELASYSHGASVTVYDRQGFPVGWIHGDGSSWKAS